MYAAFARSVSMLLSGTCRNCLRIGARGTGRLCCADPRGMRGFPDAAVACLGAGGGVLSPGTKSKIGRIFSKTLLRCARTLPSSRGIHVPNPCKDRSCASRRKRASFRTLVFSISTLYLLVHALLHFALEDSSPARLVVVCDLQDVCCVDPVVCPSSHAVVAFAVELVDRDLLNESVSDHRIACDSGPYVTICRAVHLVRHGVTSGCRL